MVLEQPDEKTAAEELSDATGRLTEEFEPDFDETPIPDAGKQNWNTSDED